MDFLGTGFYPLRQAARLVGADPAAVRRWLLGYTRNGHRYEPLWRTQFGDEQDIGGGAAIGFRDLLELRLVAAFVSHGVSLRVIRATADSARAMFRTAYPLTAKRFLTDGKSIFLEAVKREGEEHMIDMPRRQFVFSEIVRPSLYAGIEYDGTNARKWYPLGEGRKVIVLDPRLQFGAPVISSAGIPTDTIFEAFKAEGGDRAAVARIFRISPREIDAAVRFETRLAA